MDAQKDIFDRLDKPPKNIFKYGAIAMCILLFGSIYLLFGIPLYIKKNRNDSYYKEIQLDSISKVKLLSQVDLSDTALFNTETKLSIRFADEQKALGIVKKICHKENKTATLNIVIEGKVKASPLKENLQIKKKVSVFQYLIEDLFH